MLKQFGKPSSALLLQKASFFEENESHVKKQRDIAALYTQQPPRKLCKNCDAPLPQTSDFVKDAIPYKACRQCSHINGAHEDTKAFCKTVYAENDQAYAENYTAQNQADYDYRTASIYAPKAEFLYTTLKASQINPHELGYFDYGAGTGYFVAALLNLGLENVTGSEVSQTQVELANKAISSARIRQHDINDEHEMLAQTTADVVSMIGVLEHLQTPRLALSKLAANKNVKYLFISVPTFSLSVYLELLNDNVFHRQLHGGHTHLYTEESLLHMCGEFNFEIEGQWWFGTDMVDLYRQLHVNLEQRGVSEYLKADFKKRLATFLDNAQLELDKQKQSSEVHLLLRKKHD